MSRGASKATCVCFAITTSPPCLVGASYKARKDFHIVTMTLMDTDDHFLPRIESLRGLAALMVAVGHSLIMMSVDGIDNIFEVSVFDFRGVQSSITQILLVFFNGGAAVTLFFIISGFVLGRSLDKTTGDRFRGSAAFVFRRMCRIYPALVISLLFVWASLPLLLQAIDCDICTYWYRRVYRTSFVASDVWKNLTFVSADMNAVIWTIKVEVVAAVVLPAMHWINRKRAISADVCILGVLIWASYQSDYSSSMKWFFVFYLGLMLSDKKAWLTSIAHALPIHVACWAAIFCTARPLLGGHIPNATISIGLEALSAVMIVSSLVYHSESTHCSALDLNIVKFLGRISYSFYLFHLTILYIVVRTVLGNYQAQMVMIPALLLNMGFAMSSVLLTMAVSHLMYQWVERPFINLGRVLAGNLRPTPASSSVITQSSSQVVT